MSHLFIIVAFLTSIVLAMLVIPIILVIAIKHSLYDIPDARKTHTGAVPRIGGVSFFPCILFSMMFTLGIFYMIADRMSEHVSYPNSSEFCLFFCALLLLYLGGVKDDLVGLRYRHKFLIQIISSLLIVFSGLYINNLYGLLGIYDVTPWIGMPLTVLALVFIINAINLIDGIDGLASGISIFALCVYGTLFLWHGAWYYSILAFSTIGALIPFFYYNVFGNAQKGRKLFMGDSGSMTLGLILGFLAVRYACYSPDIMEPVGNTLVASISPLLVPALDVMRVILARIKKRKRLFEADRSHIHHKLMDMGFDASTALVMLLAMSSGFCIVNFLLMPYLNILVIFFIDIISWTSINMYISYQVRKRLFRRRLRDARMRSRVQLLAEKLHIYPLLFITASIAVTSCAVLTQSQLQMVTNLTVASDSVAVTPKAIFNELAAIRLERGLYYAASLTSAAAREKEIHALATASIADEQLVNRAEVYVNVLNSYLRALRSIGADARWSAYGVEWRGVGRNIDSLILRFNQTELLNTEITAGWTKLSGQYIGYMSERYMRNRQAKTVRAFVNEGDTLVAACADGLIDILKHGNLADLIENESEGLKSNYEAYLHRLEATGEMPDLSNDRRYVELVKRMEAVKKTRSRYVTALQSLKRAHARLATELQKRQKINYLYSELLELNTLALQMQNMLND